MFDFLMVSAFNSCLSICWSIADLCQNAQKVSAVQTLKPFLKMNFNNFVVMVILLWSDIV